LLLACLRRNTRPAELPPLPRIRSLAYFQPVVDELLETLPLKAIFNTCASTIIDKADPTAAQKPTLSDDR
jgi:hypothetical protein